ncbi:hypothetical protein RJ641_007176 [Dillenia turbinata]|uniref:Uncharacterized protein n=1 Tax=Dillenia turbinata TaxID=194707 RepID=A0AAN8V6R7_9MAGN
MLSGVGGGLRTCRLAARISDASSLSTAAHFLHSQKELETEGHCHFWPNRSRKKPSRCLNSPRVVTEKLSAPTTFSYNVRWDFFTRLLVYKGLVVGSAKPSLRDRKKVPHHLIDILHPSKGPADADEESKFGDVHPPLEKFTHVNRQQKKKKKKKKKKKRDKHI